MTLLFADVSGYTTLVEKLDPEWVGGPVDRLWDRLGGIIVAHGVVLRPGLELERPLSLPRELQRHP